MHMEGRGQTALCATCCGMRGWVGTGEYGLDRDDRLGLGRRNVTSCQCHVSNHVSIHVSVMSVHVSVWQNDGSPCQHMSGYGKTMAVHVNKMAVHVSRCQ